MLIILNVDYDHVDFFKTREEYFEAFKNAAANASSLIIETDIDINHPNKHTFSLSNKNAELYGNIIFQNNLYSIIKLTYKGISKEFKSPLLLNMKMRIC